ncbi:MAG: TIM barrel protein, partial [Planctomycetota bacterium]
VITFTGFEEPGIDKEKGARNCVAALKKIAGYAEKKKVTVSLEMLNSRDPVNMKGHPGYQGDHTDYCVEEILRPVSSPACRLLFDIYHVQIMDGDVIRRIRQYGEWISHVHTAGNPGRGELDDKQEINYPPIMRALLEVGYEGFVGQEFIPTRDPLQGLSEAIKLCDV